MGRRSDLDFRIRLAAEGGEQTASEVAKVQQEIARTRADLDGFRKGGGLAALSVGSEKINAAATQAEVLGSALLDAVVSAQRLETELSQIDPTVDPGNFAAISKQLLAAQGNAAGLRKELAVLPRDVREGVADSVGYLGDIDSSIQAIGGALRTFGEATGIGILGDVGGLAQIAGEFFAVAEAAPRLISGLSQLQANILKGAVAVTTDTAATTANVVATESATAAEGGLTTARGKAIAGLGIAGAAFGGLALALGGLQLATAGTRKEAEALINAERQRLEVTRRLRDLTAEQGQQRIAELEQGIADEIAVRDQLVASAQAQLAGLSDVEKGFTGLGNVLGFVGTGVNDMVDEINRYNDSIHAQQEELRQINDVIGARSRVGFLREQFAAEQELERLRDEASSDQVQRLITEADEQAQLEARIAEALRVRIGELTQQADDLEGQGLDVSRLRASIAEFESQADMAAEAMNAASEQSIVLTDEVLRDVQAREAEEAAVEATGARILETLDIRREEAAEMIRMAEEVAAERERQLDELDSINQQLADVENERAKILARRAEEEALEQSQAERKANLDARILAAKQQDALGQVQEQGAAKELAIVQKAQQEQAKALDDRNAQIDKINADFMQSELRAIEDFNREQMRLKRQLEEDLLGAAVENDVNRFIELRRQAVAQLSGQSEDFDTERQRAEDERNRAIADVQTRFEAESQARQAAAQEQLAAVQQDQQQQTAAIQNAGQERLILVDQLEREATELQKTFAEEKKALTLRYEQEAHAERVALLQQQQQELQEALGLVDSNLSQSMSVMAANAANAMLAGFAAAAGNQQNVNITAPINSSLTLNNSGITQTQAEQIAVAQVQGAVNGIGALFRSAGL